MKLQNIFISLRSEIDVNVALFAHVTLAKIVNFSFYFIAKIDFVVFGETTRFMTTKRLF